MAMEHSSYLDFDPSRVPYPPHMRQIVSGKIGGKARGLLFAAFLLESRKVQLADEFKKILEIPSSYFIGTDLFDALIEANGLEEIIRGEDYSAIRESFMKASIPDRYRSALPSLVEKVHHPLAVRSSSLLEDSLHHSFAGFFLTLFIPNQGSRYFRLAQLETAIKQVLASTYNPNARAYRKKHGLRVEDEKMAVVVQPMVGQRRANLYYPLWGGVAFSKNYYLWTDRLNRDDGLVRLVFGLGTRAVGRNYARVFSLSDPRLRPEGTSIRDILRYSQEIFDSLDLSSGELVSLPASEALQLPENELHKISTILRGGEYLVDASLPLTPGDRFVLTFDPIILSDRHLPFVPLLRSLLRALEREFGLPIDIEFAVNLEPDGAGEKRGRFYLLQARPMEVREQHRRVPLETVDPDRLLIESHRAMGNGVLEGVKDIVFVPPEDYHLNHPAEVVREVARLNSTLAGKTYLLIGPGRWGSTNPRLGVPVTYADISNAAAIVEVAGGKYAPELSYGTHFFGDLMADGMLFLAVIPERGDLFRRQILPESNPGSFSKARHIRVHQGLTVLVDGATHKGQVVLANNLGDLTHEQHS